VTTDSGEQRGRASPAARAVRDLDPACFAFVMATGIVSTGMSLLGPSWLSLALLAAACAGLAVLGAAFAARLVLFRANLAADLRAPDRAFGFFTITAALDVLGLRFALARHPLATAILAAPAALAWLLLTYGVPASLMLARTRDSVLADVDGSWLLWIVATESLSIAAATVVPVWPGQAGLLAPVAASLWCVGLVLYLMVATLILLRWFTIPVRPEAVGPSNWILMGATAITVLAGANLLGLTANLPVVRATSGFVSGFTFTLWAFGSWWIPLLVIIGLWHIRRHWPPTYELALWSIVFPLGMYGVATLTFGKAANLRFMAPLARFVFWVAVAAWVLVAVAFVRSATKPARAAKAAKANV